MDILLEMLLEQAKREGTGKEALELFKNEEFDFEQAEQIRLGIKQGLAIERIARYARPRYSAGQMELIRRGYRNGWNPEEIALYARVELNLPQMRQIFFALEEGMEPEKIIAFAKPELSARRMAMTRLTMMRDETERSQVFVKENEDEKPEDTIRLEQFAPAQITEIRLARKNRLSDEQIALIANPALDAKQMAQIRWGFAEGNLSIGQAAVYARPEFEEAQMLEIRKGLENGLPMDKVCLYALPKYNNRQMYQARLALQHGFDDAKMAWLLNGERTAHIMQAIRIGFMQGRTEEEMNLT